MAKPLIIFALFSVISLVIFAYAKQDQTSVSNLQVEDSMTSTFDTAYPEEPAEALSDTGLSSETSVNWEASFLIFTNGVKRDFNFARYFNLSDIVYIDAANPSKVSITRPNVTWRDFFATLPMSLDEQCITTGTGETYCSGESGTLSFIVNGEVLPDALDQIIQDGDKLLVSFGSADKPMLDSQYQQIPD